MKLKEYCTKNVCISSSVNIPRPLKSTHITIVAQPRLSYEGNKMNSMILFFIFPFVRYVCSVVQNHISASHVDYGNRTVVRKTSLPSKPYCCFLCLHVKSKTSRDLKWEEVEMCWQCWTDIIAMLVAHNKPLFYDL